MKYIFLHGLGQTSSSWDKVIDNLDFKDDILCPNLSKWTKNKETCYHTLYTELENYCSEIREPICLCGLSLGGILAMQYAIEHSNKVHANRYTIQNSKTIIKNTKCYISFYASFNVF